MPIDTTMTTPVDTTSVKNATGLYTGSAGVRDPKKSLDSETFLTLLVAQLKYQDPSSPMDTNEMMAQTTQLASMEQLTRLNTTMGESFALQMRDTASSLIGKQVTYTGDDGKTVSGIASSVSYKYSVPLVTVGGKEITLDAVASVRPAGAAADPADPADPDDSSDSAAA
ncbi:flagellar basal-body rod modification protein FlgD [Sanguibacter gelidistatuariae]|uniref:Flagellar basal-body rod modification protein FlgD n=1 Tax=Sanguibacter gelidistatuariae TaxID=1814289 RepID=A0A1G6PX62_9MICO|nr:flagellar hook capping FlgD N-terminal domain-containing protein [Sanguibacter gelidistatuariae]SDC84782.1 flagellar basal-body rod modification protein FlgD [Sanguibacter gelidistatuariae]